MISTPLSSVSETLSIPSTVNKRTKQTQWDRMEVASSCQSLHPPSRSHSTSKALLTLE